MALKRQLGEGGEGDSELPIKRQHLISTWFGSLLNGTNDLQEYMPQLEPFLRKLVQEAVQSEFSKLQRSTLNQTECSDSRTLQLQLCSNLPNTLFTGSRVMSEGSSPVKIILYNASLKQIVTSGPYSSAKVNLVVLDGDFGPDDREDWSKEEFDSKIVRNREGKRPLVTGELTVQLQNGVGFIGQVSFTDNSSWIRSGRFRLGATVQSSTDGTNFREAMSNPFKVKDHRGESYQKHYPPSLTDEVWRLEKIAKNGSSHKRLTQFRISSVRDFLRHYETNPDSLRSVLSKVSNKIWETIIRHATTCTLDDERYLYKTAQGSGLLFNCISKVIGVTFDGLSYHSIDNLNVYHMRMVEDLKQHAYKNVKDWIPAGDLSFVDYPTLMTNPAHNFNHPNLGLQDAHFRGKHDPQDMQTNNHHSTISSPYDFEVDQENNENSSFEIGESSQMQVLNLSFRNSFRVGDSPGIFSGPTWVPMSNYLESQLSTEDFPVNDNFQEWQTENEVVLTPSSDQVADNG